MKRIRLAEVRNKHGMTQDDVAKNVGISRSHYGLIENGQRNPRLNIAQKIAILFNLSLEEVFPELIFFGNGCYDRKQSEHESTKDQTA